MTKISYEERINLYYDRKNGMSFPSIESKYGINKTGVEYLVGLIDKLGFDILRTNENKSYSFNEKERILNRILIDNESILSVSIDEGFGSLDTESLNQALNILTDLSSNDKLIGVISHVTELISRIDNKIIVNKTSTGSKLSIES